MTFLKTSIVKLIQPHIVSVVLSVGFPRVYPFPKSLKEPKIVKISKLISYIYYLSGIKPYYINITNGKSVEDAKNEMLYNDNVNITNSTIKTGVDLWFQKYLLDYSDYLEDTVFCNYRSQSNVDNNGWNSNGGSISTFMSFYIPSDLSCLNTTDKFSTLNNKAKLKYKVGLMSSPEMNILNSSEIRKTGKEYWLSSPFSFSNDNASEQFVYGNGNISGYLVTDMYGVRSAISLKPSTIYTLGDGSKNNPYIVYESWINIILD